MKTSVSPRPCKIRPWIAALVATVFLPFSALADDYAEVSKLVGARQYKEALTKVDQYLSSKPRDPQMRFIRGVILSESGRNAEAIAAFTKITEDFPELPEPYNNLAVLHASQNQFDKARAALELAIRTNPSYATAHENLGDIYARLASQAYSKALQLDATNVAVQPKLALIRTLFNPDPKGQRVPAPSAPSAPAAQAPAQAQAQVLAQAPAQAPAPGAAPTPTPAPSTPPPTPPNTATSAAAQAAPAAPSMAAVPAAPAVPTTPAVAHTSSSQADVDAAVKRWAAAWASKDMEAYLRAYAKDFDVPGKLSRKAWEEERRSRILGKSRISVQLSDVVITVNGNKAQVRFRQNYSADALSVSSRKTLDMVLSGNRWLIVRESASG